MTRCSYWKMPVLPSLPPCLPASPLTSAMSARLSSAALLPMSGMPPAPSPRVTSFPICNVLIDSGTRLIA